MAGSQVRLRRASAEEGRPVAVLPRRVFRVRRGAFVARRDSHRRRGADRAAPIPVRPGCGRLPRLPWRLAARGYDNLGRRWCHAGGPRRYQTRAAALVGNHGAQRRVGGRRGVPTTRSYVRTAQAPSHADGDRRRRQRRGRRPRMSRQKLPSPSQERSHPGTNKQTANGEGNGHAGAAPSSHSRAPRTADGHTLWPSPTQRESKHPVANVDEGGTWGTAGHCARPTAGVGTPRSLLPPSSIPPPRSTPGEESESRFGQQVYSCAHEPSTRGA